MDCQEIKQIIIFYHINFISLNHFISYFESACNAGNLGSIPALGRSPGEGKGNPPQYSCLENAIGRGTWQAIKSMGSKVLDTTWCLTHHDLCRGRELDVHNYNS